MYCTADPCDDFNAFACGRFEANFHLPDDVSEYRVSISPLEDTLYDRGRALLEEEEDDDQQEMLSAQVAKWPVMKKMKRFYASCMNQDRLEQVGLDAVKEMLERVMGGWPVVLGQAWNASVAGAWHEQVMLLFSIEAHAVVAVIE